MLTHIGKSRVVVASLPAATLMQRATAGRAYKGWSVPGRTARCGCSGLNQCESFFLEPVTAVGAMSWMF